MEYVKKSAWQNHSSQEETITDKLKL